MDLPVSEGWPLREMVHKFLGDAQFFHYPKLPRRIKVSIIIVPSWPCVSVQFAEFSFDVPTRLTLE